MNQSVQPTVDTPRYTVTMNGVLLEGVDTVNVNVSLSFQVGTFRFTKAFQPSDKLPFSWWAATSTKTMKVVISLSVDGQTFTQVMTGGVDSHSYDPMSNTLTVVGRDRAAELLDTRIVATDRNQTASEIATALAAKHGLSASITPTKMLTGRSYDNTNYDNTNAGSFSPAINEWDLLCRLGSQEGIIPYVSGDTLYFNPPPSNPPDFIVSIAYDQSGALVSNVPGLKLTRNLTAARDVVVTYRSWHSNDKRTYSATYRTTSKTAAAPDPSTGQPPAPSKYLFVVPNLTLAQCQIKAQQMAADISQHERQAQIEVASLVLFTPLTVFQVKGTETDYDMIYYPQTITYDGSFRGFTTQVSAKFSSPLYMYDDDTGVQVGQPA